MSFIYLLDPFSFMTTKWFKRVKPQPNEDTGICILAATNLKYVFFFVHWHLFLFQLILKDVFYDHLFLCQPPIDVLYLFIIYL